MPDLEIEYLKLIDNPANFLHSKQDVENFIFTEDRKEVLQSFLTVLEENNLFEYCQVVKEKMDSL